jgi:hypothetical protein
VLLLLSYFRHFTNRSSFVATNCRLCGRITINNELEELWEQAIVASTLFNTCTNLKILLASSCSSFQPLPCTLTLPFRFGHLSASSLTTAYRLKWQKSRYVLVNGNLPLYLIKYHTIKGYGVVEVWFCTFLTSAVKGGFDWYQGSSVSWVDHVNNIRRWEQTVEHSPALGSTETPVQWVPGSLSLWVKRQGLEADHSSLPNAEVKNGGAISQLPHASSWHVA